LDRTLLESGREGISGLSEMGFGRSFGMGEHSPWALRFTTFLIGTVRTGFEACAAPLPLSACSVFILPSTADLPFGFFASVFMHHTLGILIICVGMDLFAIACFCFTFFCRIPPREFEILAAIIATEMGSISDKITLTPPHSPGGRPVEGLLHSPREPGIRSK
jgi:hypothetical protein